jgi:hypothetical protein
MKRAAARIVSAFAANHTSALPVSALAGAFMAALLALAADFRQIAAGMG